MVPHYSLQHKEAQFATLPLEAPDFMTCCRMFLLANTVRQAVWSMVSPGQDWLTSKSCVPPPRRHSCRPSFSSVCLTLEPKACGHDPAPHTTLVTVVNWQEYPSAEVCHFYVYLCPSFGPDGFLHSSQLTLHCPGFPAVYLK